MATSGSTTIEGTLNSTANTLFRLEFFSNSACDPSGNGEGETFLGSTLVTTEGDGDISFSETFDIDVPVGQFITTTVADPDCNTSEFSMCMEVVDTTPPLITPPQSITVEGDATGGGEKTTEISRSSWRTLRRRTLWTPSQLSQTTLLTCSHWVRQWLPLPPRTLLEISLPPKEPSTW